MPSVAIVSPRVSNSARALGSALNSSAIRRVSRHYNVRVAVENVINWGSSSEDLLHVTKLNTRNIINSPTAVNRAANKLNAFISWDTTFVPNLEYTTSRQIAERWLIRGAEKVYCRTTLRGNSGEGIVVARDTAEIVQAPLYTKGIRIHHEFRFHVLDGVVFDGVRKAFRPEVPEEERNHDVMNHAAGTMFVRSGPALDRASQNQTMLRHASLAVSTLGLDFGAVDILVDHDGTHHIIEVNTACGLEGTTLERYTRAFSEKLNGNPITPWFHERTTTTTNPTTTEGQQQMNISNAVVGNTVTFHPVSGNITTLTAGSGYMIERVGNEVIYVRNNNGRLLGYRPCHFQAGSAVPTSPVREELVGPADGSITTEVPPTSPERVVRLNDGTSVNVTGQATFTGISRRLTTGEAYVIVDMYKGVDSGDVFLGIDVRGDTLRYISTSFEAGSVEGEGAIVPSGPQALDINRVRMTVGNNVVIRCSAGGHNLAVGTLGTIVSLTESRIIISVAGQASNVRIQPNRVAKLIPAEHARLVAEEAALQSQQTTTFSLAGHSYRVTERDMSEIRSLLRRFTV